MSTITVSSGGYVSATSGTIDKLNVYAGGLVVSGAAMQGSIYGGTSSANTVTALTGTWSAVLVDSATVYQSGTGPNITTVSGPVALNNNAILYVTSGATASEVEDAGGLLGYIYVNSGGTLANSNITYDIVTVYAGGTTSGNIFEGYAGSYVANYGTSIDDTYSTEGGSTSVAYFYSGATITNALIADGTTATAYDGVVIDGATISSGGTLTASADTSSVSRIVVSSGGVAALSSSVSSSAYTVSAGGLISAGTSTVYGGVAGSTNVTALTGTWSAVLVDGATVYQSGTGSNITTVSGPVALNNNATLYVTSGATASGVEDAGGLLGYIYVNSGGTLANSNITYDIVTVSAGGTTSGNTFEGYAGSYVANYGTSIDDTYSTEDGSTSVAYFYSGATITNALIADGTTATAYDGVVIDGATISSGGTLTASADTSSVSRIVVSSGGVAALSSSVSSSAYTVSAGGLISAGTSTVYGGVAGSTNVTALTGTWSAVLVDGATVYQSGTGSNITTVSGPVALDDNAILYVTSGATASGVEDAGGLLGYIYVNSGGTLANSNITYDIVTVSAGGTTSGNTFEGYAGSYVANYGASIDDTYSTEGGSTSFVYVYNGASVTSAVVTDGTTLNAYVGAELDSTTVTSGGSVLTGVACFLAGSMIRTPSRDIAVEKIQIGDQISVFDWKSNAEITKTVSWVGSQKLSVNHNLPDDEAGFPVRVLKNAIADGVPYKDMLITPEHCLFFEDRFVPVRMLVNGRSIFYDRSFTHYTYFHIETEQHSVIWADGMLTESYLDTGNRSGFRQNGKVVRFNPRAEKSHQDWNSAGAAPLSVSRNDVETLFCSINLRAECQGEQTKRSLPLTTNDADLHLVTESGQIIRSLRDQDQNVVFMLPSDVKAMRIVSRASRPNDTIGPFVDDRRFLGVLVGKITLFDGNSLQEIETHLTQKDLSGWHGIEKKCRWTNGNAAFFVDDSNGSGLRLLSLQILSRGPYLMEEKKGDIEREIVSS
ncbi:Hint domain-containing protein [Acetobacter indonesiensis]